MPTISNSYNPSSFGVDIDPHTEIGGKKSLDKEDFLKLLMKQMLMQNPLKPFDSAQMLEQMATMTSLTSNEKLQQTIQNLGANIARSQVMSASQLIGRKVQTPSSVSPLDGANGLKGSAILTDAVTSVTISIKKDGQVVKTINESASGPGVLDFDWDGKDADGKAMPDGFYEISAKAMVDGKEKDMPTCGTFKVGSVAMNPTNGTIILNVDGLGGLDMSEIIKIL